MKTILPPLTVLPFSGLVFVIASVASFAARKQLWKLNLSYKKRRWYNPNIREDIESHRLHEYISGHVFQKLHPATGSSTGLCGVCYLVIIDMGTYESHVGEVNIQSAVLFDGTGTDRTNSIFISDIDFDYRYLKNKVILNVSSSQVAEAHLQVWIFDLQGG